MSWNTTIKLPYTFISWNIQNSHHVCTEIYYDNPFSILANFLQIPIILSTPVWSRHWQHGLKSTWSPRLQTTQINSASLQWKTMNSLPSFTNEQNSVWLYHNQKKDSEINFHRNFFHFTTILMSLHGKLEQYNDNLLQQIIHAHFPFVE